MIAFPHAPVDSHLIHKENHDDVLISNLRTELPTRLSSEDLASELLSEDERALLSQHYTGLTEADGLCCGVGTFLVRRSAPLTLPLEVQDIPELGFVADHYKATTRHMVLQSKYLPEEQEDELAARYAPSARPLTVTERIALSAITRRLPCNERPQRFYFNMINDLKNYFFYRKHHEHVPGLMLIEVARQGVYAQYYNTSLHKRGEITLTVSELDSKFEAYVESNYPVTLCVETATTEEDHNGGIERRRARFYQNGRRVAVIEISGLPIKMKLFKRLRIVRPDPEHWFVPVKSFAPSALFFCPEGKRIEGKLTRVARHAMEISFEQPVMTDASLNFVLAVEGIGYVDGMVRVHEMRQDGKRMVGRLSVEKMSTEAERRWLEAIKNFSHLETSVAAH